MDHLHGSCRPPRTGTAAGAPGCNHQRNMALVFERIESPGIAELSYLVGDDSAGVAAVFDPTVEADRYLALAREKKVSITHIFETHIHADLVSGARELCERAG